MTAPRAAFAVTVGVMLLASACGGGGDSTGDLIVAEEVSGMTAEVEGTLLVTPDGCAALQSEIGRTGIVWAPKTTWDDDAEAIVVADADGAPLETIGDGDEIRLGGGLVEARELSIFVDGAYLNEATLGCAGTNSYWAVNGNVDLVGS